MTVPAVPQTTWLLGAGASKNAGVPLAGEMIDYLKGRGPDDAIKATYDFVVAGVIMRSARQSLRGQWRAPNIEDVANTVDALIRRDDSEIGPFVGAWQSWLDDIDPLGEPTYRASERVAAVLQRIVSSVRRQEVDWTREARSLITALDAARYPGSSLVELRRWLVKEVRRLVCEPYGEVDYLTPLSRTRIGSSDRCAGATLNYDLCAERAFQNAGLSTCDGFRHWLDGESLEGEAGAVHVYKPHGSVRWHARNDDSYLESDSEPERPAIIFGGRNKLTARGPFLDSLLAWRSALDACRNLIIVGYSFGDDHLNALLEGWWRRSTETKRIVIVDPGFDRGLSTISSALHRRSNEAPEPLTDDTGSLIDTRNVLIIREGADPGVARAVDELSH